MSEKHTPGPWRWAYAYQSRGTHWCLENEEYARRGLTIDHRLVTLGTEEYDYDDDGNATRLDQTPNFRLIAAAPDLLAQLETAVTWIEQIESHEIFDPSAPSKHELLPQLRAAIAKARGGAE